MRRTEAVAVAAIAAGAWLLFGRLLAPFDLMAFLTAGRQVLHGYSPYAAVTTAVFRSGHAFVYPYAVAWLFAPLSALPTHAAVLAYSALSVGAIVAGCHLLSGRRSRAAVLVLVCSTTIVGLQMGTLNALLLLGLAAAWKYRDRPLVCGVIVGILAVAKLFLVPVAVWLVLRRRFRAAAAAVLTGAAVLAAGFVVGPMGPARYLRMLSALQGQEATRSWSLTSLFRNVGLGPHVALAGALAVGAVVLACGQRLGRGEPALFGAAVLASLLISPIVWSSYLVLLAVPLLAAGAGDGVLVTLAVGSWLLVTPDAASWARTATGAAAALVVAAGVVVPRMRRGAGIVEGALLWAKARTGVQAGRGWRWTGAALGGVALGATMVLLPLTARTPFAVAVASLAVLSRTTRREARPAAA
ncbi:MAG TPA: glycosyltransferase 87 family protein [Acidimicrobiales bacterium]|nr:glycosyltransferase 87 family protein [Acidimicrobiales bacterium]